MVQIFSLLPVPALVNVLDVIWKRMDTAFILKPALYILGEYHLGRLDVPLDIVTKFVEKFCGKQSPGDITNKDFIFSHLLNDWITSVTLDYEHIVDAIIDGRLDTSRVNPRVFTKCIQLFCDRIIPASKFKPFVDILQSKCGIAPANIMSTLLKHALV